MITKERLQELIDECNSNENKFLYVYGKYREYSLKNREEKSSYFWWKRQVEIVNNELHYIYEDSDYYENDDLYIKLEDLYETKEDAELVAKYHTSIVEKFEPPVYEDIKDGQPYRFNFTSNGKHYNFFTSVLLIELVEANTEDSDNPYCEQIICCHSTKENYYKAVEKARKLFLGEGDDR